MLSKFNITNIKIGIGDINNDTVPYSMSVPPKTRYMVDNLYEMASTLPCIKKCYEGIKIRSAVKVIKDVLTKNKVDTDGS